VFPKSRRDIMLLICIKAAALTLIYYVLVAPTMSPMSRCCSGSSSGATCARAASRWNLPNRPGRFRTEIDSRVERGA
jgi:hypothetical protein